MKYIKFGEKKNGRYLKAEELTIPQFKKYMSGIISDRLKEPDYSFWSRLTGKTKKQEMFNIAYIEGYKDFKEDLIKSIEKDIDLDKKGKRIMKK